MNDFGIDEIISKLYELIQDAKGVPFSGDKCSVDRNRALDLLDDLSNHLPGALKQAQTIMDSRAELITAAKRITSGRVPTMIRSFSFPLFLNCAVTLSIFIS